MTDPTTPVDRLRDKITERLELARRALDVWGVIGVVLVSAGEGGASEGVPFRAEDEIVEHVAANPPSLIVRSCESDLETLAEHTPCPGGHSAEEIAFASDLMRSIRYQHDNPYCHRCLGPSPCLLLRRLGHVYGVDLDEGTATP